MELLGNFQSICECLGQWLNVRAMAGRGRYDMSDGVKYSYWHIDYPQRLTFGEYQQFLNHDDG